MKEIPIGVSSFQNILEYNYIYVDKTKEILHLINNNIYVSFSRPRRFGKSLTLNTIETLFTYGTEPNLTSKAPILPAIMKTGLHVGLNLHIRFYAWTFLS